MEVKPYIVDLSTYIPENITTLNNRTWGIVLRNKSGIDELEKKNEKLEIVLPQQVTSISTSFLEELLENIVVRHNGVSAVLRKIDLKSEGKYNFRLYLENAVKNVHKKEAV